MNCSIVTISLKNELISLERAFSLSCLIKAISLSSFVTHFKSSSSVGSNSRLVEDEDGKFRLGMVNEIKEGVASTTG